MNRAIRRSLVAAAVFAVVPVATQAQIGFPGGIRESGRQLVDAGQLKEPGAQLEGEGGGPALNWMIGSGGELSDDARGVSGLVGFSMETKRKYGIEAALAYARLKPDGLDGTNAFSATLEVGIPATALSVFGSTLALSGEGAWEVDSERSYSAALSLTRSLGERAELVGTAAYGGSDPDQGESTSGFQPSFSAAFVPSEGTELRLGYTLDNDLDGEDSFELVATQRFTPRGAPPFQLRAGVAKHGVVSVGLLVFPQRSSPRAAPPAARPSSR